MHNFLSSLGYKLLKLSSFNQTVCRGVFFGICEYLSILLVVKNKLYALNEKFVLTCDLVSKRMGFNAVDLSY